MFIGGACIGGFIANTFLKSPSPLTISENTTKALKGLNFDFSGALLPPEIFSWDSFFTLKGGLIIILGGMLVGFGTRWAGGCTSGHAISGISNLQWPSLIAAIGFFLGGLIMTHLLFPLIF